MLIRLLSIVGTIVMLWVGGGIFVHCLPSLHLAAELAVSGEIANYPILTGLINTGISLLVGFLPGSIAVGIASFLPKKDAHKKEL
ncbi:hypothetical protein MUS1_02355 [Marinomonas ushuaiensis DSM 15871]|uniref:Uncharacterized protein n=1 Tax=Marinomonas ushuaiensis DSM 15871 TaxID=1122207 RepID=X7E9B9_9GAMM|nr:DUF808 family protein [Marinomonas ushuaiensis]ETX12694.1 hypothetical protein MUS1_02355 [Marinomonas ushuaiensis DSM 15871]